MFPLGHATVRNRGGGKGLREVVAELRRNPIIPAVRDRGDLPLALRAPAPVVFLLAGHLLTLRGVVAEARQARKAVFVHLDLVEGISKDVHGLRYLSREVRPTGIITTRTPLIAAAREEGLMTVQRIFLLDSAAVSTGIEMARAARPDVIEVLPGVLPRTTRQIIDQTGLPVIAGGLLETIELCLQSLRAGAVAVSTSARSLWFRRPDSADGRTPSEVRHSRQES